MYSVQVIVFLLAFVANVVNSVPTHGHQHRRSHRNMRRTVCPNRPHPPSSTVAGGPAPTTSVTGSVTSNTTESGNGTQATQTASTAKSTSTGKSSSSGSSSSSSSSSSSHSSSSASGSLAALFPVSDQASWTTASSATDALPLSDATFRVEKNIKELAHPYVPAPDGKTSMQAHYPEGSYTLDSNPRGGVSFYAPGPSNVDLTTAKEATFGYSVYFPSGFKFNKGGKLPGLYGGDSASEATSCSGGRRDTGCFSARLMWREDGAGELYTYLPPYTIAGFGANEKQCNVPPYSECNPTYGASVGRGAFKFPTGKWTTVTERVRLNDAGKANGELELFVNGKSVISVSGLILRDSSAGRIYGMQVQTFFGGHTSDYASPATQNAYFSDFSVAITEKL